MNNDLHPVYRYLHLLQIPLFLFNIVNLIKEMNRIVHIFDKIIAVAMENVMLE